MQTKFPETFYKRVIEDLLAQDELLYNTHNPEYVLEDTLKMLSENLHLNRGRIYLWDDIKQRLEIKYSYKLTNIEKNKGKYEVCEGITGEVFDTGKAALIKDINEATNYRGKTTPRSEETESPLSYIAVPITYGNSLFGVLAVEAITHYEGDLEANALVLYMVAEMFGKIIHTYSLCDFSYAA